MANKTTKKALLTSTMSLVLCFAMLIGSTFAWFTDNVATTNNIITAGNLDIELYYQLEGQTDWSKVDADTNVFKTTLWEPGHTEVVKLKAVNEGSLALKYQLGVNVAAETPSVNVAGQDFKLSDYIKYGVVEGAQSYTRDEAVAAVEADATVLNVAYSVENALESGSDAIVTMVVYMPTSVGNEANHAKGEAAPMIKLGINLAATQRASESDSFDNTYDEGAAGEGLSYDNETGAYVADSMTGLSTVAAIASTDATITSVKYVNEAGETVDVPVVRESAEITDAINAGSNIVVMTEGEYTLPSLANKEGFAIIGTEGTVVGGENSATGFGSNFGKNTTIKNVTFSGQTNGVRYSYAKGGTTIFDNCTFAGDSTYGFHIDESNGATFIFNNCTFSGFNAFAADLEKAIFNKCTFLHNGSYGHTNIWSVGEFNDCTWGENTSVGPRGEGKIYFDGVEKFDIQEF